MIVFGGEDLNTGLTTGDLFGLKGRSYVLLIWVISFFPLNLKLFSKVLP